MGKLERAQMNAVMGGIGRRDKAHGKVVSIGVNKETKTVQEKSWYEKAWDEIKSWF